MSGGRVREQRGERDGEKARWKTVARNKRGEERMEKERGGERWHDTGAEAQRACTWFLCSWHRFWNSPSARNAILVGWYTVKCTITAVSLKPRPATTFVTALHFDPIASSCRNVEQHRRWRGSYSFRVQLPVPRPVSAISDSETPLSQSDVLQINLRELSPIIFSLYDVD